MKKDALKSSFVVGSIALVFLIVGYQVAVFVHSAAVAKIAADRDCPDTVFVAVGDESGGENFTPGTKTGNAKMPNERQWENNRDEGVGKNRDAYSRGKNADGRVIERRSVAKSADGRVIERRSGAKSAVGKMVRENVPRRQVESFRVNPNTASVEELQRLGFSLKQAQSIDNYRNKGGRFRRKSDFAKSFVVSDSVFRRLEPYIDIPKLDINLADSAAFDTLPGIGGWFARQMIEYRERLGGYSYPEQLMEIRNFDREKFDKLNDLIFISPQTAVPYPLWTLPEDELKRHPYIGRAAHGIVLFRNSQPKEKWSIMELERNRVLPPENAERLGRCLVANP